MMLNGATLLQPEEWGMRWARPPITQSMPVPEVYVHHSAGAYTDDPIETFRMLNEYAINVKGYSAVDYSMLVHRSRTTGHVTIGVARGKWLPAATRDRNSVSKAICVVGYYHPGHPLTERPTNELVHGISLGIKYMIDQHWLVPTVKILGHRQNPVHLNATACPGDYLFARMADIRLQVAGMLNPPSGVNEVNWNPTPTTVASVKDAPPVTDTVAGKVNDWAVIAMLKTIQEQNGLPVTGKYDQATAEVIDRTVAA